MTAACKRKEGLCNCPDCCGTTSTASTDQQLLAVARELRRRAEVLTERYAPAAQMRRDRLVMIGDAGVMEYAASVIEGTAV
jgi:hypothetical protein